MFAEFEKRLLAITEGCRLDMHEPDEQDLKAKVLGDHLDNAFTENICEESILGNYQELVVILERYDITGRRRVEKFNLASLIALARIGAKYDQKHLIL